MHASPSPTCRFAPSPNGPLHLGHAYSAFRNAAVAARLGGRMLLRFENIDLGACPPAREGAIATDLRWLGLAWEEPVRRQSEHMPAYAEALDRLAARGLLYPCFCSRGDIAAGRRGVPDWPRDPDGTPLYPGTCRTLSRALRERRIAAGHPHALRLDMAAALAAVPTAVTWTEYREGETATKVKAAPASWGDVVLRRKEVAGSYHIAVVVDDAVQGVTDVVRGLDLFAATSLHRCLQHLLALPEPRYHHHRLVRGADGLKLSKSRQAPTLAALREAGTTPAAVAALIETRLAPDQGSSVVSQ